jgi:hypothetical protein
MRFIGRIDFSRAHDSPWRGRLERCEFKLCGRERKRTGELCEKYFCRLVSRPKAHLFLAVLPNHLCRPDRTRRRPSSDQNAHRQKAMMVQPQKAGKPRYPFLMATQILKPQYGGIISSSGPITFIHHRLDSLMGRETWLLTLFDVNPSIAH